MEVVAMRSHFARCRIGVLFLLLALVVPAPRVEAGNSHSNAASPRAAGVPTLFAVQSRLSTPNFQLFLGIDDAGAVAATGPLYGPAGGVYGADFLGTTFFAVELDNGGVQEFLVTVPHEGGLVGQGTRVSATPIGFPNVEGLAVVEGTLLAVSLDFAGHETRLLAVNPATGVGTLVGTGTRNVMLVGLAWDARAGVLYGAGIPFGGQEVNAVDEPTLFRVDPSNGATSVVGPLGATIQTLTWDTDLGLLGAYEQLYTINKTTGEASLLGSTDFSDGKPGTFNGIYAMGAPIPEGALLCGDANGNGSINAGDALLVLRSAVGTFDCAKIVCDVNNSDSITAADALAVLRNGVGQPIELICV